ncbi:ATP-dependent endonuclease [Arthrobacter sp. NPDC057009]|uniref:ATP-dependent nuclease n=1 Tax=Arthrobacter sp. NPDC057009 TaxID=3345996 RepID=UPI00363B697C
MTVYARVGSLTSKAKQQLTISQSGVTCIVGGNNVGKSQILRDLLALLRSEDAHTVVLENIKLVRNSPTRHEVVEWLNTNAVPHPPTIGYPLMYSPYLEDQQDPTHTMVSAENLIDLQRDNSLMQVASFFVNHLTAGSLAGAGSDGFIHAGMQNRGTAMHQLYINGELEEELSQLSQQVFQLPLTLDRINPQVILRVGEIPPTMKVPPLNRPTKEYADAVIALPPLFDQGDGVKSFIGLALTVIAGRSQILLIDEPEAFLHPAQARALGRWIGREAKKRDLQVIIATHDRDFVLGLLHSENDSPVHLIRVVRDQSSSQFYELSSEQIRETWTNPVLRYSNILQGLFHRRVVVCEADADCRFFGAVLDQLADETGQRKEADDVLFVPAGGKHGVPALAGALGGLGVETHALLDFDVLRVKKDIKAIVESMGGDWTDFDADYLSFFNPMRSENKVDLSKKIGLNAVPTGSPLRACMRLIESLHAIGVHVIPVGEMEGFDRSIDGHGSEWVSGALKENLHKTCQAVKDYVGRVLAN